GSMLPEPGSRYSNAAIRRDSALRDVSPGHFARVPADQAVRRDQQRNALEEGLVVFAEGRWAVGVDVDLADHAPLVRDRDDDLRPGRWKAGEVARVGVHVVDDLRPAGGC